MFEKKEHCVNLIDSDHIKGLQKPEEAKESSFTLCREIQITGFEKCTLDKTISKEDSERIKKLVAENKETPWVLRQELKVLLMRCENSLGLARNTARKIKEEFKDSYDKISPEVLLDSLEKSLRSSVGVKNENSLFANASSLIVVESYFKLLSKTSNRLAHTLADLRKNFNLIA